MINKMKYLLNSLKTFKIVVFSNKYNYFEGFSGIRKVLIITLMISTILVSSTYAELFPNLGGQRAGTSVFTFLKIGVGAREAAMGNAGVSLAYDASSLYWNPASASQVDQSALTISHTRYPVEIEYSYIGYIHKFNENIYLGFSSGALYTDPMEVTTTYHPYGTGEYFNYGDIFMGLTFSHKMTDRFSYGTTVKYVEETLDDLDMKTVLVDFGTFYWTGYKTLRFCVSLVNFGSQSRPDGTYFKPLKDGGEEESKYSLFSPPTEFRIGAAMDIFDKGDHKTLLSCQLNHPVDNSEYFVAGLEQNYKDKFFLRGGYIANQAEKNFTVGAGTFIPMGKFGLSADYAWSDFGVLGDIQQIQISVKIK